MFEQDRPIKPDPKAIQQYQNKLKEKQKQHQQYLRKGVSTILPCQKQNYINKINKKRSNFEAKISKAEQYEQIKSKNRQKFGQWKRNNDTQNNLNIENSNKIKPHQITVGYKPKKVHIDTREYKKPGYKPENQSFKPKENKQSEEQKLEYQKMIQYLKRMFGEFEKQKSQFEKQKQYLMFKKVIQNQEGIQIAPKVSTGLNKRNKIQSSKSLEEVNKEVQIISNISNEQMCPEPENSNKIHKFNYTIEKLYECNPFTLEQISKYTNHQEFIIENSRLYQQARQILDTQRNNPKNKIKIIKPKCTHGSIGANHSVCTEQQCTQKRITKFVGEREGWFQLWIAGRYRTVYNKNLGYKVVWYNNNDIKQEFSNGRVIVYEHKAKKVIQVQVDKKMPFWYFPLLNQLQMKDQKGNKQIIFSDGGHQVIVCSQIF